MEALDNVERITLARPADILGAVRRYRPIVIKNLFEGHPIAAACDQDSFCAAHGEIELVIQREYGARLLEAISGAARDFASSQRVTIRDYFAGIGEAAATQRMIVEHPTPAALRSAAPFPDCVASAENLSFVFGGYRGSMTSLHYDKDQTHALLYQAFGRKRILMFPPLAGRKLNPIGNMGMFALNRFTDTEKARFCEFLGGWDVVLQPGETLYIPALHWHHVEYVDHSFGLNLRFGRNRFGSFLFERVHSDIYSQAIGSLLVDESSASPGALAVFEEIQGACARPYDSPVAKYKEMRQLLKAAYERLTGEDPEARYVFSNFEPFTDAIDADQPLASWICAPYNLPGGRYPLAPPSHAPPALDRPPD